MVTSAKKFEKNLTADGPGAFGRIEYDGDRVILRTADVKTPDRGTNVRVYFDNNREEVMTGRRFDIMGSDQWLCRQGAAYRLYTNVLVGDLPVGVRVEVSLTEDAKDALGMMSSSVEADGRVVLTVLAFRPIEIEQMVSLARLGFHEDTAPPKPKSTRTGKKTKKSSEPSKDEEAKGDEGSVPEESAEDGSS